MNNRIFFSAMLAMILSIGAVFGQNDAVKVKEKKTIPGGERFDFIYTRGLLLKTDPPANAPYSISKSGVHAFGLGFGIPLFGQFAQFRVEPRLLWNRMVYSQDDSLKTFPSAYVDPDSAGALEYEKERGFFLELPIGIKLNLIRNRDKKVQLFLELGFSGGYLLGSSFKTRALVDHDNDPTTEMIKQTTKDSKVLNLSRFRYGPYARFGWNKLALYGYYRMSEIFDSKETHSGGESYPVFPQIELGFSVIL